MLLPHGFEGSGPEHSSARLERYLQLCAEHNIQVCIPTTPAQIFHLICRQMLRPYRKPLVVMTPKSLLRHKLVVSSLNDLATGKFQLVIPEVEKIDPAKVRKVVLCSGKVYYDLLEKRSALAQGATAQVGKDTASQPTSATSSQPTYRGLSAVSGKDIALVRIEQLYPFPEEELRALLENYKKTTDIIWCQEEPKNQGAWYAMQHHLRACLAKGQTLHYIGREASASPAVGYMFMHVKQQEALVNKVFE